MNQYSQSPFKSPGYDAVPAQAATSGKAITSLLLGLLSFCLALLTGIPAIIVGLLALKDISRNPQRLSGQPFAIIGIVTGCIGSLLVTAVITCFLVPFFFGISQGIQQARQAALSAESKNNLREIVLKSVFPLLFCLLVFLISGKLVRAISGDN